MSSNKDIWIFSEQEEGKIKDVTLEVLTKASELAGKLGEKVNVITFEDKDEELMRMLTSYGADKVYFIVNPLLKCYCAELYEKSLFQLFQENKPRIILFGASLIGNDLASRVSARLKTGLVTDCIDVSLNEDNLLLLNKLTYGGRIVSTIIFHSSNPQMATIKPEAMEKIKLDLSKKAEPVSFSPQLNPEDIKLKVKAIVKADPEEIDLDETDIIIAGGRGMGRAANFEILEELAQSLGGVVAASLGAVDDELAARKNLVGQTGMTVNPNLYVACGISGSIYHVLGMKDSKAIVGINKDPNAPIFKYCDMGIIGDVIEVVPAITKMVNELLKEKKNDQQ